jgi:hypothetical protein
MSIDWKSEWAKLEEYNKKLGYSTAKYAMAQILLQKYCCLFAPLVNAVTGSNLISKIGLFFTGHFNRHHVDAVCDTVILPAIKGGVGFELYGLYNNLSRQRKKIDPQGDLGRLLKLFVEKNVLNEEELDEFFKIGTPKESQKNSIRYLGD